MSTSSTSLAIKYISIQHRTRSEQDNNTQKNTTHHDLSTIPHHHNEINHDNNTIKPQMIASEPSYLADTTNQTNQHNSFPLVAITAAYNNNNTSPQSLTITSNPQPTNTQVPPTLSTTTAHSTISQQRSHYLTASLDKLNEIIVAPVVDWVREYNRTHSYLPEGYEQAPPDSCRICDGVTSFTTQLPGLVWGHDGDNTTNNSTNDVAGTGSSSSHHYQENNQTSPYRHKSSTNGPETTILSNNHSTSSFTSLGRSMSDDTI